MNAIRLLWRGVRAVRDERGAVAVEYALLLTLIALVIVASVFLFGQEVLGLYDEGADAFP